jgi:hypothetical protein
MLSQAVIAVVHDRRTSTSEAERKRSDVSGGGTGREPGRSSALASHPLLGEGRLAVSGWSDEHADARLRLVEEREQPGPLDDPALADPCFGDCRRRRLPS